MSIGAVHVCSLTPTDTIWRPAECSFVLRVSLRAKLLSVELLHSLLGLFCRWRTLWSISYAQAAVVHLESMSFSTRETREIINGFLVAISYLHAVRSSRRNINSKLFTRASTQLRRKKCKILYKLKSRAPNHLLGAD